MQFFQFHLRTALTICAISLTALAEAKPIKIFILAGQSNMEGHAETTTFPAIAKDPKTADMHQAMVDSDGKPVVCDDVWIAYSYGDYEGEPDGVKSGKLTAGYGSQHHVKTAKIGPEFTFGIYMNQLLNEPVLIIKAAWGGKSLMVDFRPPSAGALNSEKESENLRAGRYYNHLMGHVKGVLLDLKTFYPDYDPVAGYELAGFAWFQGFNDMVAPQYPKTADGKSKDYSEYSRLLTCLIHDVRNDLASPHIPFVIGVLGVDGEASDNAKILAFREAMAAPARSDEFKNNVTAIHTAKYWPAEIDAVIAKYEAIKQEFANKQAKLDEQKQKGGVFKKEQAMLDAEIRAKIEEVLSEDELFILDHGTSNRSFHYYGSAKFFGQVGKNFAEALVKMR